MSDILNLKEQKRFALAIGPTTPESEEENHSAPDACALTRIGNTGPAHN
jgi:hypothetical protein